MCVRQGRSSTARSSGTAEGDLYLLISKFTLIRIRFLSRRQFDTLRSLTDQLTYTRTTITDLVDHILVVCFSKLRSVKFLIILL